LLYVTLSSLIYSLNYNASTHAVAGKLTAKTRFQAESYSELQDP